jgi:hypothetical protein
MEFSQNEAKKMMACQNLWHIPNIHTRIHSEDPRIQNHPNNAKTRGMLVVTCSVMSGFPHSLNSIECQLSGCLVWQLMVETHQTTDPGSGEGVSIDY